MLVPARTALGCGANCLWGCCVWLRDGLYLPIVMLQGLLVVPQFAQLHCTMPCVPQLSCTPLTCAPACPAAPRTRPSTAAAEGQEAAAAGAGEPKSFYLQEMERYRSATCETAGGGDRPLVK